MVKKKVKGMEQKASDALKKTKRTAQSIKDKAGHAIDENVDVEELKEEIRQRPLLYTGFALTLGVALGSLMSRRRD